MSEEIITDDTNLSLLFLPLPSFSLSQFSIFLYFQFLTAKLLLLWTNKLFG